MKINGIDMKEACDSAWESYIQETYGEEWEKENNEFEKINKKTLFDEGFSACLEVLLSNMQTEPKPKGVIVPRD